jgi:transcriptional regulator with PAS, ATPase and Fis domain
VRGSFTGAIENKRGIFEEASGGTVFLDEVSEMSPALQVKVLRTLEEQEVRRIGSNQVIKVDVRIIAASNRNLAGLVEEGKFRQDLYYRLRVIEIDLPPLRERLEDIPLLVAHFLKKFGSERGREFSISPYALSALMSYEWPGNVRELENALESAAALTRTGFISPENLPPKLCGESREGHRLQSFYAELPSLEEMEKRYLTHVLKVTGGNKARTASILGITRRTLYRKIDEYKIRG